MKMRDVSPDRDMKKPEETKTIEPPLPRSLLIHIYVCTQLFVQSIIPATQRRFHRNTTATWLRKTPDRSSRNSQDAQNHPPRQAKLRPRLHGWGRGLYCPLQGLQVWRPGFHGSRQRMQGQHRLSTCPIANLGWPHHACPRSRRRWQRPQ
ncbi:hypothetical protein BCR44DRAFT_1439633 [Catenaria anguillulae PL171]|uniref:Uncharacterized protein n=1 Tax=Catenaria anguillulae PL171 TaxID=765915 RepID=A0A1Y2HDZ8_9FUNG|nr:hypothetical protein BCR44DRAFT_1439633 [Catenaria anguillulae PL171]